jgi:hypothetical protein
MRLTKRQSPPLYLRVTSTSKEGLDNATKMIEDMMQQDLPNLVDERRFRRREPENVERDELGRVSLCSCRHVAVLTTSSANGQRRRSLSVSNPSAASTSALRSSVAEETTSSTFNRNQAARFRSRAAAPASWNLSLAQKAMSPCIFTLRDLAPKV